ncbi:xylulokinase [Seinonella peptonophila]|uniref:Xylulokinase n=1 Tax=Seinonella peptonophila TaxID=112248 RepID=A0A1M4X995_9BACL|nr:FGGY family carbohydrate kinase [Seinonella peptonophila]SHE90089.1 xylulokinase [Seinonella peptonophila]
MSYIASFDIGTTNTKGVLLSRDAKLHFEKDIAMTTMQDDQKIEQEPTQWFDAIVQIVAYWLQQGVQPTEIALVTFSGQMQDCIPIRQSGLPVRPAILYSDNRAQQQAISLKEKIGMDSIQTLTGNHLNETLTFPKILWYKEEEPELFSQTESILINAKDYVIRQLSGQNVTDPTSASTTGLFNLKAQKWIEDWLSLFDISSHILPKIYQSDEIVGQVTKEAAGRIGLAEGTPILCGVGDAGAATIGAGVTQIGKLYAYIGTTGWMAMLTDQVRQMPVGVFHLAYIEPKRYIVVPPIMNAGLVHQWAASVFATSTIEQQSAYEELEAAMQSANRKTSQLLFLPYLNGERYPVQDTKAAGIYLGIRPTTTRAEMSCAALEGVAMAMRQAMEQLTDGKPIQQITLIGGGSKSKIWNQIIADVLGVEVQIPVEPQYIPSLGAAALGFVKLGWTQNVTNFLRSSSQNMTRFFPTEELQEHLEKKYERYKRIYTAYKDLFV